jgi:hypothetical protein
VRRPSHFLLNAATALSLVLCAATPFFIRPEMRTIRYPRYVVDLVVFHRRFASPSTAAVIGVPLGTMAFFAALPLFRLFSKLRHQLRLNQRTDRLTRGHCPSCGYDARATPDLCPECGSPPRGAS